MIMEKIPGLAALTTAEKFVLANELWDEIAADPEEVLVSDAQLAELDRRMEAYRENPTQVTTWDEIQAKLPGSR